MNNNKYKLTLIENYLLITNDEKIKEGNYFLTKTNDILQVHKPEKAYEPNGKKIISHLPLNNAPKLEGIDLLPEYQIRLLNKDGSEIRKINLSEKYKDLLPEIVVKDDVEKQIDNYLKMTDNYTELDDGGGRKYNDYYVKECIKEFINDYYKAATKVYSEEDLRKAYERGFNHRDFESVDDNSWKDFIQSLKSPKVPTYFMPEFYTPFMEKMQIKTIINKEGDRVWVGTYIN
jgi:hypothetical protein